MGNSYSNYINWQRNLWNEKFDSKFLAPSVHWIQTSVILDWKWSLSGCPSRSARRRQGRKGMEAPCCPTIVARTWGVVLLPRSLPAAVASTMGVNDHEQKGAHGCTTVCLLHPQMLEIRFCYRRVGRHRMEVAASRWQPSARRTGQRPSSGIWTP